MARVCRLRSSRRGVLPLTKVTLTFFPILQFRILINWASSIRISKWAKGIFLAKFAIIYFQVIVILLSIWEATPMKNRSCVTYATANSHAKAVWFGIWRHTLKKKNINAWCATKRSLSERVSRVTWSVHTWKKKITSAENADDATRLTTTSRNTWEFTSEFVALSVWFATEHSTKAVIWLCIWGFTRRNSRSLAKCAKDLSRGRGILINTRGCTRKKNRTGARLAESFFPRSEI